MTKKIYPLILLIALLAFSWQSAYAQDEDKVTLNLSRDFGYASGGEIQGTFSMHVEGPDSLVKVNFLIDGESIGEDSEAPFKLQFTTDNFSLGLHTLSATGYTSDGRELRSNGYSREFVSAEDGWKSALGIIVPVFGLIIVATLFSYLVPMIGTKKKGPIPLGQARNYGLTGGAICSKCNRPFALNLFSFKLVFARFDRCPHCGKWGIQQRRSLDELRAAEQAEMSQAETGPQIQGASEQEKLRKGLDDSRYQDL